MFFKKIDNSLSLNVSYLSNVYYNKGLFRPNVSKGMQQQICLYIYSIARDYWSFVKKVVKVITEYHVFARISYKKKSVLFCTYLNIFVFASASPCQSKIACGGFRGSEITLYGDITMPYNNIQTDNQCDRFQLSRTKVKTNGHFAPFMQVGTYCLTLQVCRVKKLILLVYICNSLRNFRVKDTRIFICASMRL